MIAYNTIVHYQQMLESEKCEVVLSCVPHRERQVDGSVLCRL